MSEVKARPLLTREQVEAIRFDLVKFPNAPISPTRVRDLVDKCIAAMSELAAVDAFAREKDAPKTPKSDWSIGYDSGRDALRRELRAVLGIEA